MYFAIWASLLFLGVATVDSDVCDSTGSCQPRSQALLQISKSHSGEAMNRTTKPHSMYTSMSLSTRSGLKSKGNPSTADLNEEGFQSIAEDCCMKDMMEYLKRLISEASGPNGGGMGLELCDVGGLTGFALWRYCASKHGYSLTDIKLDIMKEKFGKCPWVADVGQCKPMPVACGKYNGSEMPPCGSPECLGISKDIFMAIDASNSVKAPGWQKEVAFARGLISALVGGGNPKQHRMNVHWFNGMTAPLVPPTNGKIAPGKIGSKQKTGRFQKAAGNNIGSFVGSSDTGGDKAIRDLDDKLKNLEGKYEDVKFGETDHPQVYFTAEQAFKNLNSNRQKVVILITDGETHKGDGCDQCSGKDNKAGTCNKLIKDRQRMPTRAIVENTIGTCKNDDPQSHACYRGGKKHATEQSCDMTKCMCGVYRAQQFKAEISKYPQGSKVIVVGIANGAQKDTKRLFQETMKMIASPNQLYLADNFDMLDPIVAQIHADCCS